jgi:hypothetical protein
MNIRVKRLAVLTAIIGLCSATEALAAGGQYGYNNPTGDPADDTYQTPYANTGEGRMEVFCGEDEKLVITPVDGSAVEATCIAADD